MVTVECSPQAQMARDVGGKIMGLLCSFPSIGQGLDPAQMFMELLVTARAAGPWVAREGGYLQHGRASWRAASRGHPTTGDAMDAFC